MVYYLYFVEREKDVDFKRVFLEICEIIFLKNFKGWRREVLYCCGVCGLFRFVFVENLFRGVVEGIG